MVHWIGYSGWAFFLCTPGVQSTTHGGPQGRLQDKRAEHCGPLKRRHAMQQALFGARACMAKAEHPH